MILLECDYVDVCRSAIKNLIKKNQKLQFQSVMKIKDSEYGWKTIVHKSEIHSDFSTLKKQASTVSINREIKLEHRRSSYVKKNRYHLSLTILLPFKVYVETKVKMNKENFSNWIVKNAGAYDEPNNRWITCSTMTFSYFIVLCMN